MKSYVLSVAGIAVLTSVVSMLCAGKKQKKTVDGVLRLCILLVVASPIVAYFNGGIDDFSLFQSQTEIKSDVSFVEGSYALAVKSYVDKEFAVESEAEVDCDEGGTYGGTRIVCVRIFVRNFGMNQKDEHINIMCLIREKVAAMCSCDDVEVRE